MEPEKIFCLVGTEHDNAIMLDRLHEFGKYQVHDPVPGLVPDTVPDMGSDVLIIALSCAINTKNVHHPNNQITFSF